MGGVTQLNLIPRVCLLRRRRRARLGRWALATAGYGLVCGVGVLAAVTGRARSLTTAQTQLVGAESRLAKAQEELGGLKPRISRDGRELQRLRAVMDHPDWSVLLRYLAQARGEEVALTSVQVAALVTKTGAATVAPEGYIVRVTGLGRSQRAVSGFVLTVEASGVLDRVVLAESKARVVRGMEFVGFNLECEIRGQAEPSSGPR